ncbi:MAG: hypothetical protein ABR551_00135 [Gemmatimonadales bacterium]
MPRLRFAIPLLLLGAVGCAALQQVLALRHVEFALEGVRNGRLAGVDISRVRSYRDLSTLDLARIALALGRNELPLDFQVDVGALNPADNQTAATMTRLAWTLYLNDKETIHGIVDSSVTMPAGAKAVIPIRMRLNVLEFFDGPAEELVDLVASLVGLEADPTRVTLRAIPTITTPLGNITYPTPITIVNRTIGAP